MPHHPMMKFFKYDHLPEKIQGISAPFCFLADKIDKDLSDSAEKTAGLRKLMEARDCIVRCISLI